MILENNNPENNNPENNITGKQYHWKTISLENNITG